MVNVGKYTSLMDCLGVVGGEVGQINWADVFVPPTLAWWDSVNLPQGRNQLLFWGGDEFIPPFWGILIKWANCKPLIVVCFYVLSLFHPENYRNDGPSWPADFEKSGLKLPTSWFSIAPFDGKMLFTSCWKGTSCHWYAAKCQWFWGSEGVVLESQKRSFLKWKVQFLDLSHWCLFFRNAYVSWDGPQWWVSKRWPGG